MWQIATFPFFFMFEKIRQLFKKRQIKTVDSWSGAASNYSSADEMARCSLINFNTVAGRERGEWVKRLIALPIREEGDANNIYVDRAVFSAAGRIGQVSRPDEVSQVEFNRLVRQAARELIDAYQQMDMTAPSGVYELAGIPSPAELAGIEFQVGRAIPYYCYAEKVETQLALSDMAENTYSYLVDIYMDNGNDFAIFVREGVVYKAAIQIIDGTDVILGEFERVVPRQRTMLAMDSKTVVWRQADGRYRWLSIASTSALNRSGEIDSRELFDNFIKYAKATDEYPILNYYHQGDASRLGQTDYLARDKHCYISSGLYDDTPYGEAAAKGVMRNPNYWGNSIEFIPIAGEMMIIDIEGSGTAEIPVYTMGINTAISILPENKAAALFTSHFTKGEMTMDASVKNDLVTLFADEEVADQFEQMVDAVNQQVDRKIHRADETKESADPVAETPIERESEVVTETEEVAEEVADSEAEGIDREFDGETLIPQIARDLLSDEAFMGAVLTAVNLIAERRMDDAKGLFEAEVESLRAELAATKERLAAIETAEVIEEKEDWIEDAPAEKQRATYRPRNATELANVSYSEVANQTLAKIMGVS